MLKKPQPHRFYVFFLSRAEAPSPRLSKFCKYYGKIISVTTYYVEKDFFAPRNPSTFPLS